MKLDVFVEPSSDEGKRKNLEIFIDQLKRHLNFKYDPEYFEEYYFILGKTEPVDYQATFLSLLKKEDKYPPTVQVIYQETLKVKSARMVKDRVKQINTGSGTDNQLSIDDKTIQKICDEARRREKIQGIKSILEKDGFTGNTGKHEEAMKIPIYEYLNPKDGSLVKVIAQGNHPFELFKLACYLKVYKRPSKIKIEYQKMGSVAQESPDKGKVEYYQTHVYANANDVRASEYTVGYF